MIALNEWFDKWDDPLSKVDLSGIRFPTDALTFKKLREVNPDVFDKGDRRRRRPAFEQFCRSEIYPLVAAERLLALFAYALAKEIEPPLMEYDAISEEVEEIYIRYGLARGPHEARELIRDVEQQARALAGQRHK